MQSNRVISIFFFCVILFPLESFAESPSALVDQGNTAYEKKQYDDALKAYDAAGVDLPESPQIYYNKGAAYYRKGEYEKAKEAWEKAALNAKEP
nr:tetratricopeptide repeat protein [Desulfobacterales bacterium]